MIVTQKMFGYCGRLRAVSLFVNRSAMLTHVEAIFKSTFGFSYVLFVTVVTLYHVDDVFGVAVNVMINKSSFAGRLKCIHSKSVVYVIACLTVVATTERAARFVSSGNRFMKFGTN